MARAIWSGTISFGLVNVPVKLYTATEEKDISFNQFDERSGERIRMKRVREDNGREVAYENIVKGYETSKGKYVMVTPEELEAVDPGPRRTIELEDFVDLDEIDPIYFVKTYYVGPDGSDTVRHAYALLREAMRKSNRAGIGRFVFRTKQYLVAIRPLEDVLALTTLYFADEVRNAKEVGAPGKLKLSPKEMQIATRFIDAQTTTWKPERYDDTYRESVMKLIRDKSKGKEITVEKAEKPAPVTDLVAALEASLKGTRSRTASKRRAAPRRKSA